MALIGDVDCKKCTYQMEEVRSDIRGTGDGEEWMR